MLKKLAGYRTYLTLWIPILVMLAALLGMDHHALETYFQVPEGTSWGMFVLATLRALDQTFMRLGIAGAQKTTQELIDLAAKVDDATRGRR